MSSGRLHALRLTGGCGLDRLGLQEAAESSRVFQGRPAPAPTSRTLMTGDRPGIRPTETSLARSNSSRPREAENRERPRSAQPSNASSKLADRRQPASSQQTTPTWRDLPGSREAGSHHCQGIGPYNGRRSGLDSGPGRSKTETASLQPGSLSTASNP